MHLYVFEKGWLPNVYNKESTYADGGWQMSCPNRDWLMHMKSLTPEAYIFICARSLQRLVSRLERWSCLELGNRARVCDLLSVDGDLWLLYHRAKSNSHQGLHDKRSPYLCLSRSKF